LKGICWGILGTGAMAEQFASALSTVEDAVLYGVASRTRACADQFAARFGVKRSYQSAAEMLADPAIDIVYVVTRNEFHHSDTMAVLDAGKSVLCEKPFALTAAEGRVAVDTARDRDLFCMEAMWMRFSPAVKELRELVHSGRIGFPQLISAQFGVSIPFDRGHRVYANPGGGSLYDLGVYPVSLVQCLLGKPKEVCSRARMGETRVDEQFMAILKYESGAQTMIAASVRANLSNDAQIFGTQGRIDLTGGIYFPDGCRVMMNGSVYGTDRGMASSVGRRVWSRIANRLPMKLELKGKRRSLREGYASEADAVQRSLRSGKKECAEIPLSDTLEVLEMMDSIRSHWSD
jgi:predicted dehydrogenase